MKLSIGDTLKTRQGFVYEYRGIDEYKGVSTYHFYNHTTKNDVYWPLSTDLEAKFSPHPPAPKPDCEICDGTGTITCESAPPQADSPNEWIARCRR